MLFHLEDRSTLSDVNPALAVFLHVCRALAIVSVILGFWGAVLAFIGMKCTKIGGSELANARVTFAASITYLASGKLWHFKMQNIYGSLLYNHYICIITYLLFRY